MISSPYIAKKVIEYGGSIYPLIIPAEYTNGLGLMNPCIFVDENNKIIINLRSVNYTFYHSEKKLFQHPYGPLTYLHPENDIHLRTDNYYLELNEKFEITRFNKIDMTELDSEPLWDFVGLEDARIFKWLDKLYISGVRRDTTINGQGRMELSEIIVNNNSVKEISRFRIPAPKNLDSYCEKNWMPIIDIPFHYIKWTNPTEVIQIDPENKTCKTVFNGKYIPLLKDQRGGAPIISWKNYYLTITHEVDLFKSEEGRKDAVYRHRFILWDKNWKIVKYSKDFSFLNGHVEFAIGLCLYHDSFLITFGFQDNAAYLLKVPEKFIENFLNEEF